MSRTFKRKSRLWQRASVGGLVFGLLVPSCASDESPASCPNDLPASCPSGAPGYAAVIAPLLAARCESCHRAEGAAPYDTYPSVFADRITILSQVFACRMPSAPDPPLEPAERAALLAWLVCGAQNN